MAASLPSSFLYHRQHCLTLCIFLFVWLVCVCFALLVCLFCSFVLCVLCFFICIVCLYSMLLLFIGVKKNKKTTTGDVSGKYTAM